MTKSSFLGPRLRTQERRGSAFPHTSSFVSLPGSGSCMVVPAATVLCLPGLCGTGYVPRLNAEGVWFELYKVELCSDLQPRGILGLTLL